jgi:hypothetical protein
MVLEAMDEFFRYEAEKIPDTDNASGYFLKFLDRYSRRTQSSTASSDWYLQESKGWS